MKLDRSEFTFTSDAYGYMIYYRGKPLGGAGTKERNKKHWRHARADRKMFHDDAEREINSLVTGSGQARFLTVIRQIRRQKVLA
jgi:hypothetical protein